MTVCGVQFKRLFLLVCCCLLNNNWSTFREVSAQNSYLNALRRGSSQPNLAPSAPTPRHHHPPPRRANSQDGNGCKTNYKFDYLALTLEWSPGSCATSAEKCIRRENRFFTIHGMWPQMRDSWNGPSDCCFDNIFYYNEIQPMEKELNKYWFSYFYPDNGKFWSHEWTKHGTCTRDVPNLRGEKNYFATVLTIAKSLPILDALSKSGILPDKSKSYQSADINRALANINNGKTVMIDCALEHNQKIPLLTGLKFCFDTSLKPVDCPRSKSRCSRDLYLLPS